MPRPGYSTGAIAAALALSTFAGLAWPQSTIQQIQAEYDRAVSELEKHLVEEQWIDGERESPVLLARVWQLAATWAAAWLVEHDTATAGDLKTALDDLDSSGKRDCLALDNASFLVASPGLVGNVFIVTKAGDRYRAAWSIAQDQEATGRHAPIVAAWRAENARHGGRGAYGAASGDAGPVVRPRLGLLPTDAAGHARFYIDGIYAQSAGGTVGAQTTVWLWDGRTARLLAARDYVVMLDQRVGTRLEGDLLKVRQKKGFRSFFSCGMCEGRQMDWIVRITPRGIEELGEKSAVPELDSVDELFYRLIHGRAADDIATPTVIRVARRVVGEARSLHSGEEWRKFPSLGMMEWTIDGGGAPTALCVATDDGGPYVFRLRHAGGRFFITDMKGAKEGCKEQRDATRAVPGNGPDRDEKVKPRSAAATRADRDCSTPRRSSRSQRGPSPAPRI